MRTILIAVLAVATVACNNKRNPQAASTAPLPSPRVPALKIEARPFAATVPLTGTLVSRSMVDVKAETTGRVLRFLKQEGETVREGEELIWVNDENYRLDVRHTKTAVQLAEATVERAKVLASHVSSELERANNLIASGGITDKDLKSARIADQDAKASVQMAQAQLEQTRTALELAEKRQRDTIIRAPVAGEIQKRHVNPGAYVEPPTPVFTLVDNQRLEVESPVPSADMGSVAPGQQVTFTTNAYPGATFEGKVVEVLPAVETESRSARVRISVNNASRKLRAGMFVQGEILTGMDRDAVVIPATAVYRDDRSAKNTYVFVIDSGKAVRRDVLIGRERGSELEIVQGLKPGEVLIAEQSIEITNGVPVEARR
jgi:membrane fusion protein (multidrug efflux system)